MNDFAERNKGKINVIVNRDFDTAATQVVTEAAKI
jgi:hypothetical protein